MKNQVENPKKIWLEPQLEEISIETLNPFGFLNEIDGTLGS
jgi:hypothetical protein